MTSILEHPHTQATAGAADSMPREATIARMIVLNANALLFTRPEGAEAWELPSGLCNPDNVALEACPRETGMNVAEVRVISAHRDKANESPTHETVALAEVLHWIPQPKCEAGAERSKWVRITEAFVIPEDDMVFSPGTASHWIWSDETEAS